MTTGTADNIDRTTQRDFSTRHSAVGTSGAQPKYLNFPKRLFIHIGTHKTGTTSIQQFLRLHAEELQTCGVFVPKSGTLSGDSGHHNIAWELRNDARYCSERDGTDALIAELAACREKRAVISSEDFEYLVQYPEKLRAFDAQIEAIGFSTTYIVYFRNRDAYARSLHCELVNTGLTDDFETFRDSIDTLGYVKIAPDLYYEFRYDCFVRSWEKILGKKVKAFSYDDALHGRGLLPSFLTMIGASEAVIEQSLTAPTVNTMFDKFQQAARELSAIKASRSWRITAPLRSVVRFWTRSAGRRHAR